MNEKEESPQDEACESDELPPPAIEWALHGEVGSREELAHLMNARRLTYEFVEVGVHRAEFACKFLKRWQGQNYYAVDPWMTAMPGYADEMIAGDREPDYQTAMQRLEQFGRRVHVVRATSDAAVRRFRDNSLDGVYIDANHAYDYVKYDIVAWIQKVKRGGLIAGHDIINGEIDGVRRAVKEVIHDRYGLPVYLIAGDAWTWYSWKR